MPASNSRERWALPRLSTVLLALLADVVRAARDHGATHVWANVVYLRPGTREHFLENLARDWPELLPMYERLYAGHAYLPDSQVKPVRDRVRELARRFEVADRRTIRLDIQSASQPRAEQLALLLSDDARSITATSSTGAPASRAA